MGIEIERKFLVIGTTWKKDATPVPCRQGYLCPGSGVTVRVRTMGEKGFLTVKGRGTGPVRREYEFEIPLEEAMEMLETLCSGPLIIKNRYHISYRGLIWEVDEFTGDNSGLVIAEVELTAPDQNFPLPEWVGQEVTGDPRYFNAALVGNPYCRWREQTA